MKRMLKELRQSTDRECRRVILGLLERGKSGKCLDLACADGNLTLELGSRMGTNELYGLEINEELARQAKQKGVKVFTADLNTPFPIEDESFDVVCASQIMEHLYNTDLFIREMHRVLKWGGIALISTPNLAAAYSIMFLILGLQPLSAFVSDELYDVGNPFGTRRGDKREVPSSHAHLRIFTRNALKELFQYHGFEVEKIVGVGYYPFPVRIGRILSRLDPRHSVYLAMRARKI